MKTIKSETIEKLPTEGQVFYRHITTTEKIDKDGNSSITTKEKYLDSDYNVYVGCRHMNNRIKENERVGSVAPGVEEKEGYVGIWKVTKPAKKMGYKALVLRQDVSKASTSKVDQNAPATWISRH